MCQCDGPGSVRGGGNPEIDMLVVGADVELAMAVVHISNARRGATSCGTAPGSSSGNMYCSEVWWLPWVMNRYCRDWLREIVRNRVRSGVKISLSVAGAAPTRWVFTRAVYQPSASTGV